MQPYYMMLLRIQNILKIRSKNFGRTITKIVVGLTKISKLKEKNVSLQAENFKKCF